MERQNETQKALIKIRAEQEKAAGLIQKGQAERNQMELMAGRKFTLHFIGGGLKTLWKMPDSAKLSNFQVYLSEPMSITEIQERMKPFGRELSK